MIPSCCIRCVGKIQDNTVLPTVNRVSCGHADVYPEWETGNSQLEQVVTPMQTFMQTLGRTAELGGYPSFQLLIDRVSPAKKIGDVNKVCEACSSKFRTMQAGIYGIVNFVLGPKRMTVHACISFQTQTTHLCTTMWSTRAW